MVSPANVSRYSQTCILGESPVLTSLLRRTVFACKLILFPTRHSVVGVCDPLSYDPNWKIYHTCLRRVASRPPPFLASTVHSREPQDRIRCSFDPTAGYCCTTTASENTHNNLLSARRRMPDPRRCAVMKHYSVACSVCGGVGFVVHLGETRHQRIHCIDVAFLFP